VGAYPRLRNLDGLFVESLLSFVKHPTLGAGNSSLLNRSDEISIIQHSRAQGRVRVGLRSAGRMIWMRMINPDNAPRTAVEFPFGSEPALRIHVITIVRAIRVQVSTLAKCMNHALAVCRFRANQEPTALVWIRRLHMIVDLTQH